MPRRQERIITKRTVDALSVEHRDAVFWDRDLPGFGIRVYPSGLKKYVVQSRGPGGSKRATLGRHGKLTADEARRRAAEAIDRIKRGEDPIPPPPEPEPTMAVLAERYMRDYVPSHCRASSAEVYRRALDNHILPALGEMRVGAVGREQVAELHYAMRGAPHAANAVLKIVAKMLSLAVEWGLREHGPNPCRAVRKYRTHPRERFLTGEEYCRLGRAVDELEAKGKVSRHAAAAIRLLVLTGCRRNEVLELRWDDIDRTAGELRLRPGLMGASHGASAAHGAGASSAGSFPCRPSSRPGSTRRGQAATGHLTYFFRLRGIDPDAEAGPRLMMSAEHGVRRLLDGQRVRLALGV